MNSLQLFNQTMQNAKTQDYIKSVLAEKSSQFINNIVAIVGGDTKLQQCQPMSLLYAGIKATALDLPIDPNLGFAYIIPYGDKAQFQIGYRGLKQLAIRSGQYSIINTSDVKEGEIKTFNRLTGRIEFEWLPDDKRNTAKVVGYVSYFRLVNGFESTLYMTIDEIQKHGTRYSKTYKNGTWQTDFDKMASKTVTKLNLSRNGILSVDLKDAIKYDQAVITENQEPVYVDNSAHEKQDVKDPFQDAEVVSETNQNENTLNLK